MIRMSFKYKYNKLCLHAQLSTIFSVCFFYSLSLCFVSWPSQKYRFVEWIPLEGKLVSSRNVGLFQCNVKTFEIFLNWLKCSVDFSFQTLKWERDTNWLLVFYLKVHPNYLFFGILKWYSIILWVTRTRTRAQFCWTL